MRRSIVWAVVLMLTLGACAPTGMGAGDGTEEAVPSPTEGVSHSPLPTGEVSHSPLPTEGSTSPIPTPSGEDRGLDWTVEKMEGAVIIYQRSGGFSGLDEAWRIASDGRIVTLDGQTWRADPERVVQLIEEIERLGLPEAQGQYLPADPCCDRFTYELAVLIDGRVYAVRTMDGTSGVPQAVWDSLQAVNQFIAQTQP